MLQSVGSWRVQHDLMTERQEQPHPLYVESKKKWYKWTYLENRVTDLENEFMVARGRGGILIVREFGKVMYTLLYSKRIPSTRTYCIAQGTILDVIWQLGWVGVWGRMDTYTCMAESLHCSPQTITTLLIGYTPIQNKKLKVWKKRDVFWCGPFLKYLWNLLQYCFCLMFWLRGMWALSFLTRDWTRTPCIGR